MLLAQLIESFVSQFENRNKEMGEKHMKRAISSNKRIHLNHAVKVKIKFSHLND